MCATWKLFFQQDIKLLEILASRCKATALPSNPFGCTSSQIDIGSSKEINGRTGIGPEKFFGLLENEGFLHPLPMLDEIFV
jgi:hypothetical protein